MPPASPAPTSFPGDGYACERKSPARSPPTIDPPPHNPGASCSTSRSPCTTIKHPPEPMPGLGSYRTKAREALNGVALIAERTLQERLHVLPGRFIRFFVVRDVVHVVAVGIGVGERMVSAGIADDQRA